MVLIVFNWWYLKPRTRRKKFCWHDFHVFSTTVKTFLFCVFICLLAMSLFFSLCPLFCLLSDTDICEQTQMEFHSQKYQRREERKNHGVHTDHSHDSGHITGLYHNKSCTVRILCQRACVCVSMGCVFTFINGYSMHERRLMSIRMMCDSRSMNRERGKTCQGRVLICLVFFISFSCPSVPWPDCVRVFVR